jgi:glutamyl endopeptidase
MPPAPRKKKKPAARSPAKSRKKPVKLVPGATSGVRPASARPRRKPAGPAGPAEAHLRPPPRPQQAAAPAPPPKGESEFPGRPAPAAALAGAALPQPVRVLSAWHAQYTSPSLWPLVAKAAQTVSPAAAALMAAFERINRPRILDYPWRCICWLNSYMRDGSKLLGTGWLAGPRTVITAGHCVYNRNPEHPLGFATRIFVVPACNGESDEPFNGQWSQSFDASRGWLEGFADPDPYDFGVVVLPNALDVGYFGFGPLPDDELANLTVNVSGYPYDPGNKPDGTQWWEQHTLSGVGPYNLYYADIPTQAGQSGSPVWFKQGEDRYVLGIHNHGVAGGGYATRITPAVSQTIEHWLGLS